MRSLMKCRTIALFVLLIPISGCGTIFGGTTEIVRVTSAPAQASLTTQPPTGTTTTPASLSLQRKNSYVLTASLDGYRPAELQIRQEMRVGVLVADVLLTGLLGVVVDAVTGGWWNLEPNDATLVLERADGNLTGPERIEIRLLIDDVGNKRVLDVQSDVPGVRLQITPSR